MSDDTNMTGIPIIAPTRLIARKKAILGESRFPTKFQTACVTEETRTSNIAIHDIALPEAR